MDVEVVLRRFESPDEVRQMVKGRFELVTLGGVTIGRATYEPGWRWSEHVGPGVGADRCSVEHVGLALGHRDGRVRRWTGGRAAGRRAVPHPAAAP